MRSLYVRGPVGAGIALAIGLACTSERQVEPGVSLGGAASLGGGFAATSAGAATSPSSGGTSGALGGGTAAGGAANGGAFTSATGGKAASGGTVNAGGALATGGALETGGGALATGGAPRSGGASATGGSTNTIVQTGLPNSCGSPACNAATPVNPEYTNYGALGNVTMYTTQASDGGACQYGATKVMYFAAINVNLAPGDGKGQWQEGRFCGQCVEVTALTSQGPKQVVVRIMDRCADENCGIDLGGSAPSSVMVDGFGRYQGAWRSVSCAGHPEVFDGEPSLFVKEGASAYWSVIQVRNPMAAVVGIDWQKQGDPASKGALASSAPSIENFWSIPAEVLQASATFALTVRYSDGSTAAASLTSAQLASAGAQYPME